MGGMRADDEKPVAAAVALGLATHEALVTLYPEDAVELRRALFTATRLLTGAVEDIQVIGCALAWGKRVGIKITTSREDDGHDAGEPFEVCFSELFLLQARFLCGTQLLGIVEIQPLVLQQWFCRSSIRRQPSCE